MKFNAFLAMPKAWLPPKFLLVMKLTTLMLVIALVQASAKGYSQKITLNERNAPLEKVIQSIEKQSGYVFFYDSKDVKQNVNIHISNASIDAALEACFKDISLTYKIADKTILLQQKEPSILEKVAKIFTPAINISGVVTGENIPLSGVVITIKRTGKGTVTNLKGEFTLTDLDENDILVFTYIGYDKLEIPIKDKKRTVLFVSLKLSNTKLDEVQVVGYGQTTSQRISTGSTTKVTAAEIAKQPVNNVLQVLAGQVPGLLITQNSGSPGAGISVQIRAANALPSIDGVPATGIALR